MKIVCDSCGTKYSISDDKVRGKVFKIRCKKCSHIIVVRGTNDAAAAAAPATATAPAEGGWHVVVDGEQVGPVPEADIRARFERGEITADTYVWKEGFADWLKLSTVPDFVDLAGAASVAAVASAGGGVEVFAAAAAAVPTGTNGAEGSGRQQVAARSSSSGGGGGLFGAVDAAASVEESDVFAAPARAGGGDLFASPAAAPAAADDGRWPAAHAAAANHDGGRIESLTGQRHENSVLFSLSNLQSLAMPAAATRPLSTTAPTSDGSGLIDIRAMAATTLGSPMEGRSGGGLNDDLPSFGAFSSAAPVLLPLQTSSGPSKWLYVVITGMVILVGVIGLMAYKLFSTKPPTVATEVVAPPPAPVAAVPEAAKPAAAAGAPVVAAKPSTIPDENLPPRETGKGEAKAEAKAEKPEHHRGAKGAHEKKVGMTDEKKAGAAAAAAPEPVEKKPAKGSLDDLLEGALSNRRPSGAAKAPRPTEDDAPKRAEPAAGPISRSAVVAGMNALKPKVNDCYKQFKVPGTAMVNVIIGKSGKVSSATVTGSFAGTPTGSCVERAVKAGSFPASSDGLSTPYPFLLR
jgi:predicted Zn finger-like uncharacterized protein